jgi:pilus assembly protein Flp/PilA
VAGDTATRSRTLRAFNPEGDHSMLDCMYLKLLVAFGDLRDRLAREEGQALVEYALIISLIAVVAIAALQLTGNSITGIFNNISSEL